jgi:hypothetical protein
LWRIGFVVVLVLLGFAKPEHLLNPGLLPKSKDGGKDP